MVSLFVYPLYGLSIFIVCGWIFVWFMHLVAILNAKLKLHKKHYVASVGHHDHRSKAFLVNSPHFNSICRSGGNDRSCGSGMKLFPLETNHFMPECDTNEISCQTKKIWSNPGDAESGEGHLTTTSVSSPSSLKCPSLGHSKSQSQGQQQYVMMPPTPPLTPASSFTSVAISCSSSSGQEVVSSISSKDESKVSVLENVPPSPASSSQRLHSRSSSLQGDVSSNASSGQQQSPQKISTHSNEIQETIQCNSQCCLHELQQQQHHHQSSHPVLLSSSSLPSCVSVSRKEEECLAETLPGVSIIKPLVGVDPFLACNLESFFRLNYPRFELLFCIHYEDDPSLDIVTQLRTRYPSIPCKVFLGGMKVGTNPKINNMQPGYEAAIFPLILISDSGIMMKEDTLLDMVSCMSPDVSLVHQMPYTCDRKGFPSILEKVYFGTAHARIYLSADFLGINCPTGMSALMRKKVLDDLGGIKSFAMYLAEDYFFAKRMTDKGWKIRISSRPALQNSETPDVESFHNRISRWAKLRFAMVPHTILLEPLSECLILGVIASWALNFLFQVDPFAVYLFHLLTWFLLDFLLLSIIQAGKLPFSKTDFVAAWSFRELTALLVFLKALWDPDIKWRTGTYRLKWGGIAEEVKPKI